MFSGNVAEFGGGAVFIRISNASSTAGIERCTFEDNQKGAVRVILDTPTSSVAVRNTAFVQNLEAGGIVCTGGSLSLESCTFTANESSGTAGAEGL